MNKDPAKERERAQDFLFMTVVVPLICAIALYVHQFGGGLSDKQDVWGQFGDFLGGVVNPMVGLVTVVLLLVTLERQRKELEATKNAGTKADLFRSAERVFEELMLATKALEPCKVQVHGFVEHFTAHREIFDADGDAVKFAQMKVRHDERVAEALHSFREERAVWRDLAQELVQYFGRIDALSEDRLPTEYFRRRLIAMADFLHAYQQIPDSMHQALMPAS